MAGALPGGFLAAIQPLVGSLLRAGLIAPNQTSLGDLLAVGFARGDFVRALARHSDAWSDLVERCRRLCPQDGGTPSALELRLVDEWLTDYGLDTPWMRDWAGRAVVIVSEAFDTLGADAHVPIDDVVIKHRHGAPQPDAFDIQRRVGPAFEMYLEWQADEHPPIPGVESKQAFMLRMEAAWAARADLFERPMRASDHELHARWLVEYRVGRALIADIVSRPPQSDPATVSRAMIAFEQLIGLPHLSRVGRPRKKR